jgi:DNA-binding LacI/PurR family transcriptional regulator
LQAAGIEPQASWIGDLKLSSEDFMQRGYDHMKEWLQNDWRSLGCTALLVHNDRAAVGAMDALREFDIHVPRDVSVIGFDGTAECEFTRPRLSSVGVALRDVGERAVKILCQMIAEEPDYESLAVIPTHLQIRESTAPPVTRSPPV